MIHLDEAVLLRMLDRTAYRTVRDTTGFGDGLSNGIAAVRFVVTAQPLFLRCFKKISLTINPILEGRWTELFLKI